MSEHEKSFQEKLLDRALEVGWSNLSESQQEDFSYCLDADKHTPHPISYLGHHAWMDKMQKTHKQLKCKTCGRWAIWVKK
jgi:hypothetical protein